MPSTKRQRQRRERAVGDAAAAALFGEAAAARANPDASLFFRDDADTETASKRARRVAKKKVATASSTESALTRKVERRRAARPAHAGAAAAAARATAAATAAARAAPPTEDLWGDTAEVSAADEWTAAPADGSAPATSLRARRRPRRAASAAAAAGDAEASGASYNPSKSSHRALLAEAEAIEAARRAAEDAETDWWAERDRRRLASEDEAEDDSASESASESDDGGENGADGARLHKSSRSLKKGRAQRNRMKRARLQAFEKTQRDDGKRQRVAFDGLKRLRRELDVREVENAAAKAREKARPPLAVPRTAPPAVARADELTDALRSNKAARATGVADLHAALAAAHRPVKRAQPKKQRKLKYRGARLLNRYRERPI